jgi:tetratricopeptide (TPR) repeat protein
MRRIQVSKYFFSKEMSLAAIGAILFVSAGVINIQNEKPALELSKQDTALNINSNLLVYMSAGNKRLLTDLLWVQTLIESDIEHYKKRDLNSWLYLRFNSIATLDPKFYENYLYGGQFLSIVKDDLEGADKIFDKGLENYPSDYKLNYNAGFLNFYEMGNFKEGLIYLEKIADSKEAPLFFRSIVNKLKLETGVRLEEIFNLVLHNFKSTDDQRLKTRLLADLYALKAEIDLKCLNNQKNECSYVDFNGNPYIRKGDHYYSPQTFMRYRINKREANPLPSKLKQINYLK